MSRSFLVLCFTLAVLGCEDSRAPVAGPPIGKSSDARDLSKAKKPVPKAGELRAGVAKVDITNKKAIPAEDPLYVKALVLKHDETTC